MSDGDKMDRHAEERARIRVESDTGTDLGGATTPHPFRNPGLPADDRIADLLSRLTIEEKIALLKTGLGVPRLGIPETDSTEGVHGLVMTEFLVGGDLDVPTTTFPQTIGMSHTWEPDLIQHAGEVIGREARYIAHSSEHGRSKLIVLAPNTDLARDPHWGRTDETYGEDPYFTGVMTSAMVRGLQGDHPTYWQAASLLKHFLANSNEDGRLSSSSDFDERLLREYYAAPFEAAVVEGGARCYMTAYNSVNGIPCTVHPILRELTMDQWGVDGIICTDFLGMPNLVRTHHLYPDVPQATAASIKAGISQFLGRGEQQNGVREALAQGLLTEGDIDQAVARNVRVMIRLGLLDPEDQIPYANVGEEAPWHSEDHRSLARRLTQQSIVLLKNEPATQSGERLLPISPGAVTSIAVVGPLADRVLGGLYTGRQPYTVSPLQAIRDRVNAGVRVLTDSDITTVAPGQEAAATHEDMRIRMGDVVPSLGYDPARAVDLARAADVAVVCVGNHPWCGGWSMGVATPSLPGEGMEALDRQSLTLEQEDLIKAVHAANPNMVVVLISSFPYAIRWSQEHVPAILHVAHGSQELGRALADVLFGDVNPAGRLTMTWPKSVEQLPAMLDYDIRHGRTYMYLKEEPLYPFGYGLSYSTFNYHGLRLDQALMPADGVVTVSVDVTNTSDRAGDEVVQLYVTHLNSQVERPRQELKGFSRIHLEPGEIRTVTLPLCGADLAYWSSTEQRWIVESDTIEIRIGPSSAKVELSVPVEVAGDESPTLVERT